jgi:hypothetical protein
MVVMLNDEITDADRDEFHRDLHPACEACGTEACRAGDACICRMAPTAALVVGSHAFCSPACIVAAGCSYMAVAEARRRAAADDNRAAVAGLTVAMGQLARAAGVRP